MKRCFSRSLTLCLFLLGVLALTAAESTGYFEAIKNDPSPTVGESYYLRHCFMYEKNEHVATNYWRGALVPINTQVTLQSLDGKRMLLRIEGTGETVKVVNVPNFTKADMTTIAARMLSPTPIALDEFEPEIARAIKNGTMRLGMTKEQVVMARGYPPGHQTASLEQDAWKYWSSRFVIQTIVFADGILSEGRGIQ